MIVVVVVSCGWMPVPLSESTGWVAGEVEPKVNVPLRLPSAPGVKLAVSVKLAYTFTPVIVVPELLSLLGPVTLHPLKT